MARFQREMKLVGRLDHPNVVRAFDADQINRVLYIVMEYVPGTAWASGSRRRGRSRRVEMIDYAAQAALGLAHAHEQGIVHRDIKPSNILLTEDRRIKILDLGLGVLMEADSLGDIRDGRRHRGGDGRLHVAGAGVRPRSRRPQRSYTAWAARCIT